MYTMKDVAKKAAVSLGTVSNYINKTKPVRKVTGQRIQLAIEELGFSPNYAAKMLKTHVTRDIGVILPNLTNPFYVSILAGIESVLHAEGYQLSLVLTQETYSIQEEALNDFSRKCHSGILLITCDTKFSSSNELSQKNTTIPMFYIDRMPYPHATNFLGYDYALTMTYLLTTIFEKNPHATIGLVTGNPCFSTESECIRSYFSTYGTYAKTVHDDFILSTNSTKEDAFKLCLNYLRNHSFDFIITTSEPIAEGLLEAAHFLSIRVPEDLHIISFGEDLIFSDYRHKLVIKTSRMAHKLGALSAQYLLDTLDNKSIVPREQSLLIPRMHDKIVHQAFLDRVPLTKTVPLDVLHTDPLIASQPTAVTASHISPPLKKSLRIALLNASITQALIPVIDNFIHKTGIQVFMDFFPQEELLQLILKDSTQEECFYDLFMYDLPWFVQLASQGILEDISRELESCKFDTTIYLSGLFKQLCCFQSSIFGLPFLFSSQVMLYRKDFFQDTALKNDFYKKHQRSLQIPTTWKEFNHLAEFFTRTSNPNSPVPYGTAIAWETQEIMVPEFLTRLWGNHGKLFNLSTQWTINTPEFYKGLCDFLKAFLYTPSDSSNYSIESTIDAFIEGKTALLITYTSYLHKLIASSPSLIHGKYACAPVPGNNPLVGGWGLGINAQTTQKKEAFSFLNWACGKELSHYFTLLEGQSPHEEIYDNDELLNHYPWLSLVNATKENPQLRRAPYSSRKKVIPIPEIERILFDSIRPLILMLKEGKTLEDIDLPIQHTLHLIHQQLSNLFRTYGY
jgi:multiple sugar transport system substrate-binding protein